MEDIAQNKNETIAERLARESGGGSARAYSLIESGGVAFGLDQDWEEETSTYLFSDGSELVLWGGECGVKRSTANARALDACLVQR